MNLVKVRQINVNYQDNKQIIANYTPELYENSGEYYELLGIYKTKERALEVLDEIQKMLLIDLNITGTYQENDLSIKSNILGNMVKVFIMPEE